MHLREKNITPTTLNEQYENTSLLRNYFHYEFSLHTLFKTSVGEWNICSTTFESNKPLSTMSRGEETPLLTATNSVGNIGNVNHHIDQQESELLIQNAPQLAINFNIEHTITILI